MTHSIIKTDNYLLVVDDSEIAIGDTVLVDCSELEVLDIRKVNDYYNEQFLFEGNGQIHMDYCKKIISHLPLNNSPVLEGVDLLPPIEDDVEKLADDLYPIQIEDDWDKNKQYRDEFIEGYNKAKEKYKYTEEQMKRIYEKGYSAGRNELNSRESDKIKYDYIQSLQQPKTPVAFECEMVTMNKGYTEESDYPYQQCDIPKTTTNSQGFTQWVGQYIY
jgi:bisphosphoglycerate-dependent phosphoglycerate mutase